MASMLAFKLAVLLPAAMDWVAAMAWEAAAAIGLGALLSEEELLFWIASELYPEPGLTDPPRWTGGVNWLLNIDPEFPLDVVEEAGDIIPEVKDVGLRMFRRFDPIVPVCELSEFKVVFEWW